MTRTWFLGWSAFVAISWVALAGLFADDETCSWICFSFSDVLTLLMLPAAVVWGLGLIALYITGRLRGRRSSSDAAVGRETK